MERQKLFFYIFYINAEKKKKTIPFFHEEEERGCAKPWLCFFAHGEHSAEWGPSEVLRWPCAHCQQASLVFLSKIKQEKQNQYKNNSRLLWNFRVAENKLEPRGFPSKSRCHQLFVFHLTTTFGHWFLIISIQPASSKHVFNYRQQPAANKTGLLSKSITLKKSRPEII